MAQSCIRCGRKIGVFSQEPLNLFDDRVLCHDCYAPVREKMDALYSAKSITEFEETKNEILSFCAQFYDEQIKNDINKVIDIRIFKNLRTFKNEIAKQQTLIAENYMLTTGFEFSGFTIKKYIGVLSGQVVLGTGFLSEFSASFSDFLGEESSMFANKLETAKNAAIERLITKSTEKGGNAIIGVDFDYITFHGNMIGVVANGTSVVVERIEE